MRNVNITTKLVELALYCNMSERLRNVLLFESRQGTLPYETIEEYLKAGETAKAEFKKIPNIGRKSVSELDSIILKFSNNELQSNIINDIPERKINTRISELIQYNNVSTRLNNTLNNQLNMKLLSELTVDDYFNDPITTREKLSFLKNVGSKTISELESIITEYVTGNNVLDKEIFENNETNKKELEGLNGLGKSREERDSNFGNIIKNILTNKEYEVICLRAIDGLTLEEIGTKKNVTRERIRQIEKKGKDKFRKDVLFSGIKNEIDFLINDSHGEVCVKDIVSLFNLNEKMVRIILYIYLELADEKTVFKNNIVYRAIIERDHKKWNADIDEYIFTLGWPINLDDLHYKLLEIPKNYLTRYLLKKRGAEIENSVIIKLNNVPISAKVRIVLKSEKKAMHTSELTSRINSLFDEEYSEHHIGTIVNRMEEALIVGRGLYALYEYLDASDDEVENIRNEVYDFLLDEQRYISSKVIYQELFNTSKYNFLTNEYILHGIIQDDLRFVTKRGFMVGLTDYSNKVAYLSLGEQIEHIVKKYGVVSTKDILKKLSMSRKIFQSNIDSYVDSSEHILKIARGQYVNRDIYFKSKDNYWDFIISIEIILQDEEQTLLSIYEKIKLIEKFKVLNITKQLLMSVLEKEKLFKRVGDYFELTYMPGELKIYSRFINNKKRNGATMTSIYDACNSSKNIYLRKYLELDYRRASDISEREDVKVLYNILGSFGF